MKIENERQAREIALWAFRRCIRRQIRGRVGGRD
jgi:hypothetical protein